MKQLISVAILLAICFAGSATAASFDCSRAASASEKLICANAILSDLDEDLAVVYSHAKRVAPNPSEFTDETRSEWRWREANCRDKDCLLSWYSHRRTQLQRYIDAEQTAPVNNRDLSSPPVAPQAEFTAQQLFIDYQANEVAADQKYKNKKLRVSGIVVKIGKDFKDDPFVSLATGNPYEPVNAYFSDSDTATLASLKRGSQVIVNCRGNGAFLGSPLLDCHNH